MPLHARTTISIVISVYNGGKEFQNCLASLAAHRERYEELIVVNDGSTDDTARYAEEFGARILQVPTRRGPAHGRNVGALAARGDVILFLDGDVCLGDDTISRIAQRLEDDPGLGAVFGSYDSEPSAPFPVSQFRNLLHHYVHQTGNRCASTFWAGCGAIRRKVLLESGGFNAAYSTPCVEDLELGMRLTRLGVRIALDPSIQVKHLKRWTLWGMITTDIWRRGIPWTRLILESDRMPNDLNLRVGARASVALAGLIGVILAMAAVRAVSGIPHPVTLGMGLAFLFALAAVGLLNFRFYRVVAEKRRFGLTVISLPLHLVYFLCCGTGFVFGAVIHYWGRLGLNADRAKVAIPRESEK